MGDSTPHPEATTASVEGLVTHTPVSASHPGRRLHENTRTVVSMSLTTAHGEQGKARYTPSPSLLPDQLLSCPVYQGSEGQAEPGMSRERSTPGHTTSAE